MKETVHPPIPPPKSYILNRKFFFDRKLITLTTSKMKKIRKHYAIQKKCHPTVATLYTIQQVLNRNKVSLILKKCISIWQVALIRSKYINFRVSIVITNPTAKATWLFICENILESVPLLVVCAIIEQGISLT